MAARENMTYITGMRKSNVSMNSTWDPKMSELFNATKSGDCLSIYNGTTTNVNCGSSSGFICEEV
jgi:hypothetical protein